MVGWLVDWLIGLVWRFLGGSTNIDTNMTISQNNGAKMREKKEKNKIAKIGKNKILNTTHNNR